MKRKRVLAALGAAAALAACSPTALGLAGRPRPAAAPVTGSGVIVYSLADRGVFRIRAQQRARPEPIAAPLDRLSRGSDEFGAVSRDGRTVVVSTTRFGCGDWACLVVAPSDLSSARPVKIGGEAVHASGRAAVGAGGTLLVYTDSGPHQRDLYVTRRNGDAWTARVLLTGRSPHAWNDLPQLSPDGRTVLFDCGDEAYATSGTSVCEARTDGSGTDEIVRPSDGPGRGDDGRPAALHSPSYAPDGSVVFEADWGADEAVWRKQAGVAPRRVAPGVDNDNSPCVLGDGRIVSLWMGRPGNSDAHELKVMPSDADGAVLLPGTDVSDSGLSCS